MFNHDWIQRQKKGQQRMMKPEDLVILAQMKRKAKK
jgi:hypothetical protein